jgi:hypothetical protein
MVPEISGIITFHKWREAIVNIQNKKIKNESSRTITNIKVIKNHGTKKTYIVTLNSWEYVTTQRLT